MLEGESPFESFDFPLDKLTGSSGCDVRDGCIVLDGNYPIELQRCDTPEKVLGWIEQLGDKPRFQPLLRDFVLAAAVHNNFNIGYGM
jgi:hypothetical protein